jgi:putative pyruvate formate lyase activating enzyme
MTAPVVQQTPSTSRCGKIDSANIELSLVPPRGLSRSKLAGARVAQAYAALTECRLCEHRCGVNRLKGECGLCKAGPRARVFSAQVEVADELAVIPTYAIALSGCDLRCEFCITRTQSWNPRAGEWFDPAKVANRAEAELADGARTVMILGGEPTIHLPAVLEFIAALPDEATLVWKTNAHASVEALALLDGLVDVWLPDYKFGNDECARRLARVTDYSRIVQTNLRRMSGLMIVRHLLMPGHIECCWRPIAEWLAEELPELKVSLRDGFWPGWRVARHGELCRMVSPSEKARARTIAQHCGLRLLD